MWISSAVVPLVHFADRVQPISSTRLDLVGLSEPPVPEGLAGKLREFDEVVSWYGSNRPDFRALMPNWTFLPALPGNHWREHASDFFLQQVGGIKGTLPKINIGPIGRRNAVVIHPFSGSSSKNWPLDRYLELAEQLPVPVEWVSGPDEQLDTATRFDNLLDLASWMSGATAYLGNDSGISHLAAALSIPSVVLFGPTNPAIWTPRGRDVTHIQHEPLKDLSVAEVLRAVLAKL